MNIKDLKNKSLEEITKLISNSSIEDIAKIIKELEINQPQYGLYWEKKDTEVIEKELYKDRYPYLSEREEFKILNDENAKHNILIEGDNYHALKLLQYTHAGKIDVIYIDPPYNTGNKDFMYNDEYINTDDIYRHSKWLNFMNERLKLAKELLSDDGIIFISIDENEQSQLKLLCDNIFGERNFISTMPRKTATHIRKNSNHELQNIHDYVLFYAKNKTNTILSKKHIGENSYPYNDYKGNYRLKPFQNSGANATRTARPNLFYPIYYNNKTHSLSLEQTSDSVEILPKKVKGEDGRWLWSKEKFLRDKHILTVAKGTIYKKEYEWEVLDKGKYQAYKSWLDEFLNKDGTVALNQFNLDGVFSYPKPVELIKFLIQLDVKKDLIVLDFFAGSGTTGQAVLELNKIDEGNRCFILCTNNENEICNKITYPRLNKVINGYISSNTDYVDGLGGNLDYYKIDFFEKENLEEDDYRKFVESKGNYAAIDNIIKIKEEVYDCVFVNEAYRIYKNSNKIVGVFTKNITDKRREKMLKYLKDNKYDSYEKKIYIYGNKKSLSSTCSAFFDGISTEIIPIDLIEILKKKPE